MSLVAYGISSSDEDSDNDTDGEAPKIEVVPQQQTAKSADKLVVQDNISDDEDTYSSADINLEDLCRANAHKPSALYLPKPVNQSLQPEIGTEAENNALTFAALPLPKHKNVSVNEIVEEDDEFLHKKVEPEKIPIEKPPVPLAKGPVKISIPSLKDFHDVDKDLAIKAKNINVSAKPNIKGCALLTILPKAKSEQNFAKTSSTVPEIKTNTEITTAEVSKKSTTPFKSSLIPDTVKNRRPAHNTEGVDGLRVFTKKSNVKSQSNPKPAPVKTVSESEESDSDDGDFFSLNTDVPLPEVSTNEINALVASKAARIAGVSNKYLSEAEQKSAEAAAGAVAQTDEEMRDAQKRYHREQLDEDAMQALVGSSAKRRRKEKQIQIVDISAAEVLPDREEWMRSALAASTEYQPTGVLNDDEPVAGTRRKHQITYLAHKAKANEAELQAMWSANRQNRRATQSKYGF